MNPTKNRRWTHVLRNDRQCNGRKRTRRKTMVDHTYMGNYILSNINPSKNWGSTWGFRKENSPCSASGTCHVNIVKKQVIGQYKRKKDAIVTMADRLYPWSHTILIFQVQWDRWDQHKSPLVNTSRSFSHSWLTTGLLTRVIQRVPLVEKELLTLPEHMSPPPVFSGAKI
jgi:hypothetical protein